MPRKDNEQKYIDFFFNFSLLIKGIDALLELIAGILLLIATNTFIQNLAIDLTHRELLQDPTDFFANHLVLFSHQISQNGLRFASIYLVIHGMVKIFLVISLLKKKLWAYPTAIVLFTLFIAYQLYRFSHTHSVFLIILSIFDTLVVWLIWQEYQFATQKLQKQN